MSTLLLVGIAAVVGWILFFVVVLALFAGARRGADQELEDMEQIAAVSRPAPLDHPHVRAGTAWGKPL